MNGVRNRSLSALALTCALLLFGCGGSSNSADNNSGNTGSSNGTPTTSSSNPGNSGGAGSGGTTSGTGTTGTGTGSGTTGSTGSGSTGSGGTGSGSTSTTYLYAGTSINEGGISGYKVDTSSGNLTEISGSPTKLPSGFTTGGVMATNGSFVYTVNRPNEQGGAAIYTFKVDATSGVLSPVGNAVTVTSQNDAAVRRLVLSPDGKTAYLLSQLSVTAVALNNGSPANLNAEVVTTGFTFGIGVANHFAYVGVQDGSPKTGFAQPVIKAIPLNPDGSMGAAQTVVTLADSNIPYDLTVDAAGKYVAATTGFNNGAVSVWAIDSMTGVLTAVPGSPFTNSGDIGKRVRFNPSGTHLYLINNPDFEPRHEDVKVFSVGNNGALTLAQTLDLGTEESVTDFEMGNDFGYVANQTQSVQGNILVLRRDSSSGQLSQASATNLGTPPGGLGTVHF